MLRVACLALLFAFGHLWAQEPEKKPAIKDPVDKTKELETPVRSMARLLLEDEDEAVRRRLAIALMRKQKEGKSALPALFLAASKAEKSPEVRKAASKAILKFDRLEVIDALLSALKERDQDPPRKRACCEALAVYFHFEEVENEKKIEIIELLDTILIDGEAEVRQAAARALDDIETKRP